MQNYSLTLSTQAALLRSSADSAAAPLRDGGGSIAMADFHAQAAIGRHSGAHAPRRQNLQERLLPRRMALRAPPKYQELETENDDLQTAALAALEVMQQGGSFALEQHLEEHYDILERHSVLRELLAQLDQQGPLSQQAGAQVTELLEQLQQRHAAQLAPALQAQALLEHALAALQDGSVAALRASLGAPAQGKNEQALSPLTLANALKSQFGAAHFGLALDRARSRLAAQFRTRPQSWASPQLCLSLADASSFAAVHTCFAVAGELRRDVSASAGVLIKSQQLDTTLVLLGVSEARSSNVNSLLASLLDASTLTPGQRRQVYLLLRQALAQLPLGLWNKDAMAQRGVLLDQLHKLMISMSQQMEASLSREARLEQSLYGQLGRRRRDGQGGCEQEDASEDEAQEELQDGLQVREQDAAA